VIVAAAEISNVTDCSIRRRAWFHLRFGEEVAAIPSLQIRSRQAHSLRDKRDKNDTEGEEDKHIALWKCCPSLRTLRSDAVDLMIEASEHRATWIAGPVDRLGDDFFEPRTRIAGDMT
jgi:hypothetical protein